MKQKPAWTLWSAHLGNVLPYYTQLRLQGLPPRPQTWRIANVWYRQACEAAGNYIF